MSSKKLLVVSDTHLHFINVLEWATNNPHDILIHLGDLVRDGKNLSEALSIPTILVRGNNDHEAEVPWEITLPIYRHKILAVHGHWENVQRGGGLLAKKAVENGCDIALFGHTHQRADHTLQGVRLLNPGSATSPRDFERSILSLEICDSGELYVNFVLL